ncbi:hypothetical protein ASG40_03875 [Methylobacterium sp. Leaf399]|uniref:hypothetical protein n=1 Tax=unclassified Methylobacterium TaxID=2615210 RepID=UPI0006F4D89D|nr:MULTISPECIES: hypothetical protein [unclassified Methylobacterium]KQP61732.1 hypothetical protein ASF39_03440 [Methylobacterium sp. Leaf108]KQT19948.1 hypothetical protein ASG40_03875 [Methylobacterium sp. Leaf399]KQT78469.1 hypothetical protein ASG59_08315 [Methylobacterium sp. Leaf466]
MRLRDCLRPCAALVLSLGLTAAALAADVVYPPSSRFGFTPPSDMAPSKRFSGFERLEGGATLSVVELPPSAYVDLEKSFTDENLKSQGFVVSSREAIKVAGEVDAVLFTGEQPVAEPAGAPPIKKWLLLVGDPTVTGIIIAQSVPGAETEETMRGMLTGVHIRPALTLQEQVAALPFKVGTAAGFRPVRVLAGNSMLMTYGANDEVSNLDQPILVLAQAVQQPPAADQREAFARAALYSNQTMKDFVIERSQSYRQNGVDWHEMVARAKDLPTDIPVVISQTIRFAPDGYLRAVGVVRAEQRDATLSRFRDVVDSIQLK